MSPSLSIVTITWNNAQGLAETLASIGLQSSSLLGEIEVIIVDNLSDDGTEHLVSQYSGFKIRYIRERDAGIYDALNKGTANSRGNHILYLNAGDVLRDARSLETMFRLAIAHPPAPAIVCGAIQRDSNGREKVLRNVPHNWFKHAFGLRSHCHAAMIFNADAVRAAGGYSLEADFAGDYDLILRLGLLGKFPSDTSICVTYDGSGLSASRKKEIPLLLHRIRVRRFQYTRWAAALDRTFVAGLESYRSIRRFLRLS